MTQKSISGLLLLLTMLLLLVTSCNKTGQKPIDPVPVPTAGKLAKMAFKDGSYDSVFYQADGSISRIKIHYALPGPYTETYDFEYNSDKKVSKVLQNNGEYFQYSYVNGQLAAVAHYVAGNKQDQRIYDYQDGKLISIEEYHQPSPNTPGYEFTGERILEYYPDGNLKKETSYSFDPQTRAPIRDASIEYSDYDLRQNPADQLSRFLYLSFIQFSRNNPRKTVIKNEQNGSATEFLTEYTYNASLTPSSHKTTFLSGGQQVVDTVMYYYY